MGGKYKGLSQDPQALTTHPCPAPFSSTSFLVAKLPSEPRSKVLPRARKGAVTSWDWNLGLVRPKEWHKAEGLA